MNMVITKADAERERATQLFEKLNRGSVYGYIDYDSRVAVFHSLRSAERFWEQFKGFDLSYVWPKRLVTFTVGREGRGSATITKVTPVGKSTKNYTLTESSYQRLRRVWGSVERTERDLAAGKISTYFFVY